MAAEKWDARVWVDALETYCADVAGQGVDLCEDNVSQVL
jgi:hypothetical protein